MTIFNGAFMNNDTFHRVVTIIACTSIVITAVYILRVIGRILYGTCRNEAHLKLTDATWDERLTVICPDRRHRRYGYDATLDQRYGKRQRFHDHLTANELIRL